MFIRQAYFLIGNFYLRQYYYMTDKYAAKIIKLKYIFS